MHTVLCVHWRQRKKNNAHNIHSTCSHTIDNAGQCTGLRPSRPSRRPGQCTQSTQSTMHHVHCTQCKKMHTIFTVHTITELGQWTGLWGGSLDDEQGAQNVHRAHKQHTTYTLHSAQNQDNTHDIHSVESHRARTMYRALEMETLGPTQCLPPCLCTWCIHRELLSRLTEQFSRMWGAGPS